MKRMSSRFFTLREGVVGENPEVNYDEAALELIFRKRWTIVHN
jgi:hypothetical protein